MGRPKKFDPDKAVDDAMNLFWRQGYEATSVQQLCSVMGIQKGSFYDSFDSKRELFLNTLARYEALNAFSADLVADTGSARAAIAAIFNHFVALSATDNRGCFIVNTVVELSSQDPEIAQMAAAARQKYEDLFHELLLAGQEAGEFQPRQDAGSQARFLTNAVFGMRVTAKSQADRQALEDIVAVTLSVLD